MFGEAMTVGWYNNAWHDRLLITLASPSLADFPSLLTANQMTARFWQAVMSTGADIVATAADGVTKLKRQLVPGSFSVAAKTIELYVKTPVDATTIYIYYNNPAGAEVNDADTWIAAYKMVQHMNDDPDTSTIQDSTASNIDGTKKGAAEPAEAAGAFSGDKAQDFDGSNDFVDLNHDFKAAFEASDEFTIECVANHDGISGHVFRMGGGGVGATYIRFMTAGVDDFIRVGTQTTNGHRERDTYPAGWNSTIFVHIAFVFTGGYLKTYVNGVLLDNYNQGGTLSLAAGDAFIGCRTGTSFFHKGDISETRVTDTALSQPWIAATYQSLLNNAAFATGADDGTAPWPYALRLAAPVRTKYRIEVRDNNGTPLWVFKDIAKATLERRVNDPALVKIFCPLTTQISQMLDDITGVNEIWVWRDNVHLFGGPIKIDDTKDAGSQSIEINALDYLQELKGEFVELYDAAATPGTHIAAFLAQQIAASKVLLGTIEPQQSIDITVEKAYTYNAIMDLRDAVGGYVLVSAARKLNWYHQLSESTGQQIRYRKDLKGITVTTDWYNFANRLFVYGDGIDLTDAGLAVTYIEDTASMTRYKRSKVRRIDTNIQKPSQLLAYAQRKLQQLAHPKKSYAVDMMNFAEYNAFDKKELGAWVRLLNSGINVDTDVQIVGEVLDLVHGQRIELELSSTRSSIIDNVDYY